MRDVHWRNPNDGKRVHGFVVLPVGHQPGRRYPMVTILHGGPTSAWQRGWPDGFTDWGQLLAAKGYITFFPNVRGSLGAGVDYINANTEILAELITSMSSAEWINWLPMD